MSTCHTRSSLRGAAHQALLESEEQFRTLAETASDAIITIDDRANIIFVNAGAVEMFGYSQSEMVGQSITMLMPEEMRSMHQAGFARYRATGRRNISWKSVELPGRHKDGHAIQLELSFAEYNKGGKRLFTSVVRDITRRKQSEEALRESEERYRDLFENNPFPILAEKGRLS